MYILILIIFYYYMLFKFNKFSFCVRSNLPKLKGYIMYCAPGVGKNDFVKLFKEHYNMIDISPESF